MAWTTPATVVSGELMTPTFWNQQVRDDAAALRAGGLALTGQTQGDLLWATSSTTLARMAAMAGGVPYYSGGTWTVARVVDVAYPVGYVYLAVVSTNPATLLGAGTWVAFGAGRMLVGVDTGDADFLMAEVTGGSKTHTLTTAEMPAHAHTVTDAGHAHEVGYNLEGGGEEFSTDAVAAYPNAPNRTSQTKTTGVTIQNAGSGTAHSNLPPYVVVYAWKRIA